jgi:hypothetical protein
MAPEPLRALLETFDIFLENGYWDRLVEEMDEDGDGQIDVGEFMKYFAKDKEHLRIATIKNISVAKAKELIQDAVRSRYDRRAARHSAPAPLISHILSTGYGIWTGSIARPDWTEQIETPAGCRAGRRNCGGPSSSLTGTARG